MGETNAKYHHLIPRVYMSAWERGNGTLQVEFLKNRGTIERRNKDNIAGINHFYSIKAGMPICEQCDTDLFFEPLAGYTVEYEGSILRTTMEMREKYSDFKNWKITRPDGTIVGKKPLRDKIEKVNIPEIELKWSTKYENLWKTEVKKIEQAILQSRTFSIPAFDRDFLMRFYVALDWRSIQSNAQFEEEFDLFKGMLEDCDIPEEERLHPHLKTGWDEFRHNLLLKIYRDYLNDTGIIYEDARAKLIHTNFHFLISDGPTLFCTSDNPAFMHTRDDGQQVGLLPITPRILMGNGRCEDEHDVFYVSHITDEAVQKYNTIIAENATEFVIIPW
ncbi:MAG: DUF4238 domain-containing protein [Oscillospiraceae bacterium]|jgi:hypothetical protein|nr:DUF4238 domain-containing protein [Oscillospiraceae bacterium]